MLWYRDTQKVARLKEHIDWFYRHYGITPPVSMPDRNVIVPVGKDNLKTLIKDVKYLEGYLPAYLVWAVGTYPRLIDVIHTPSLAGPKAQDRGIERRAARMAAYDISARGVAFIAEFEGFESNWRDDGFGNPTIGYGHTHESLHGFTPPLTVAEGRALLRLDLNAEYVPPVRQYVTHHRSERVLDALTSFVFNLGPGVLHDSNQIAAKINRGDLAAAATAMLRYDHANGVRVEGLSRRRRSEVGILLHGNYSVNQ